MDSSAAEVAGLHHIVTWVPSLVVILRHMQGRELRISKGVANAQTVTPSLLAAQVCDTQ
jgi:hypothetical protein